MHLPLKRHAENLTKKVRAHKKSKSLKWGLIRLPILFALGVGAWSWGKHLEMIKNQLPPYATESLQWDEIQLIITATATMDRASANQQIAEALGAGAKALVRIND